MEKIKNYLINNNVDFRHIKTDSFDMIKVNQGIKIKCENGLSIVVIQLKNRHYRIYDPNNLHEREKALKLNAAIASVGQNKIIDVLSDIFKKTGIVSNEKTIAKSNRNTWNRIKNLDFALKKELERNAPIFIGLDDALNKSSDCKQFYLIQNKINGQFLEDALKFEEYYTSKELNAMLFQDRKVASRMINKTKAETIIRTLRKNNGNWELIPFKSEIQE